MEDPDDVPVAAVRQAYPDADPRTDPADPTRVVAGVRHNTPLVLTMNPVGDTKAADQRRGKAPGTALEEPP